jgi:hypothetical protein
MGQPVKSRVCPIRVDSVGRPAAVSSLAALLLALAARPSLKVVSDQSRRPVPPVVKGPG